MDKQNRLIDDLIADYPDRRDGLEQAATEFYATKQDQLGQSLIAQRLVSPDELEATLAKRRLRSGKFSRHDIKTIERVINAQQERAKSNAGAILMLCNRAAMAKGQR